MQANLDKNWFKPDPLSIKNAKVQVQPEIIVVDTEEAPPEASKATTDHKDAKHMKFKVKAEQTFCGGFSGVLVPFSTQSAKRAHSSYVGKRNRIFVDVEPEESNEDYTIPAEVDVSGAKDQKDSFDENSKLLIVVPEIQVDVIDASTGRKRANGSEDSQSGGDGIAIDRHVISPERALIESPERGVRVAYQHRGSIGLDETMDSKDFFEPDEISMVSAPNEMSSSIMPDLNADAQTGRRARRTAQQFFKPKLFQNLGNVNT